MLSVRPTRSAFVRRTALGCTAAGLMVSGLLVAGPAFATTNQDGTIADLQADLADTAAGGGDVAQLSADLSDTTATLQLAPGTSRVLDLAGHSLTVDTLQLTSIVSGSPTGASLTIRDSAGGGHLTVTHTSDTSTAAIEVDASSTLDILSGTVTATASAGGTAAAIGGGGAAGLQTESAGTIEIDGGTVTATGSAKGAGIGGGDHGTAGSITIDHDAQVVASTPASANGPTAAAIGGGASPSGQNAGIIAIGDDATVTATSAGSGAAIGGGYHGDGGTIGITGYSRVTATGDSRTGTAGIGDGVGATGNGSNVTITGSQTQVTATGGGQGGAGIGGSLGAEGDDTVSVTDSTVTATGVNGPGIGGVNDSTGATLNLAGVAQVAATGGGSTAPGVGSGTVSSSATVYGASITIGSRAQLTVGAANGVSALGASPSQFGSVQNSGALVLPSGNTLTVPAGPSGASTFSNYGTFSNLGSTTITGVLANSGTIANAGGITVGAAAALENQGTVQNLGTLAATGHGSVDNPGTIVNTGTVSSPVTGEHFLLDFNAEDGSLSHGAAGTAEVFADSLQAAEVASPVAAPPSAGVFAGWNTASDGSGTWVDTVTGHAVAHLSSVAGSTSIDGEPVAVHLYAIYEVYPVLPTAALSSASVGTAYTGSVGVTAGTAPITYSETGAFPAGLALDASTGAITGTPTRSGSYTFTVTASNANHTYNATANTVTRSYTLTVAAEPLAVAAARTAAHSLPYLGGSTVSVTLGGLEPNEPYTVSVGGHTLLSGTATSGADFVKSVTLPAAVGNGTRSLVLAGQYHGTTATTSILTADSMSFPVLPTATLATATAGSAYTGSVAVTAGTKPVAYSWTGQFPAGLSLNAATGAISGTPTTSGTYDFTVTASNASSAYASPQNTVSRAYTVTVAAQSLRIAVQSGPVRLAGSTASVTFGGLEPGETWSITVAGSTVLSGTATSDAFVTKTFTVPASAGDGVQAVVLTGKHHSATVSGAITTAALKERLSVAASSKPKVGHKLAITVSHLFAGESVHVAITGPHRLTVTGTASAKGVVVLTLKHGLPKKGTYTITVTGAAKGRTGVLKLKVAK